MPRSAPSGPLRSAALAGFCAVLLGIGLARFAYTPLLPALIAAGWVTPAEGAYLGAANLAGYLAGAAAAPLLTAWATPVRWLRASMVLAAVSLALCAVPLGFWWMLPWRFLAGMTGAVLMVLAAPTILAAAPAEDRARLAGFVFTGIGLGIVLSGTGVPALVTLGVGPTWLGTAIAGLALTAIAWRRWPAGGGAPGRWTAAARPSRGPVALVILGYASDGVGFVPHTLFLADFVARGLGQGVAAGGAYWAAFGLGAALGAALAGRLAGRAGFLPALAAALAVKAVAVALPAVTTAPPVLALSAAVVGALTPGMVVLGSGVAAEIAGRDGHVGLWGRMTLAFAAAQAIGAYGLSWMYAQIGDHQPLFLLGALALTLGTLCVVGTLRRTAPGTFHPKPGDRG